MEEREARLIEARMKLIAKVEASQRMLTNLEQKVQSILEYSINILGNLTRDLFTEKEEKLLMEDFSTYLDQPLIHIRECVEAILKMDNIDELDENALEKLEKRLEIDKDFEEIVNQNIDLLSIFTLFRGFLIKKYDEIKNKIQCTLEKTSLPKQLGLMNAIVDQDLETIQNIIKQVKRLPTKSGYLIQLISELEELSNYLKLLSVLEGDIKTQKAFINNTQKITEEQGQQVKETLTPSPTLFSLNKTDIIKAPPKLIDIYDYFIKQLGKNNKFSFAVESNKSFGFMKDGSAALDITLRIIHETLGKHKLVRICIYLQGGGTPLICRINEDEEMEKSMGILEFIDNLKDNDLKDLSQ